jgi:hypothetical protein
MRQEIAGLAVNAYSQLRGGSKKRQVGGSYDLVVASSMRAVSALIAVQVGRMPHRRGPRRKVRFFYGVERFSHQRMNQRIV